MIFQGDLGMAFELQTRAFSENGPIPARYTSDGADLSPELSWNSPPSATQSFVLICDDPDAPRGTWVHWVVYNIPKDTKELPEGIAAEASLPDGTMQGINDFERVGYGGPSPPRGPPHRYFFKLYALDCPLKLAPKATKKDVEKAMSGHILSQATLVGTYCRRG